MALSIAALTLGLAACSRDTSTAARPAASGTGGLFDPSVAHQLSIAWDDTAYQGMIAAYQEDDNKAWISATITIDGTKLENVGLRLKGNSTLRSLNGSSQQGGPGNGTAGTPPQGGDRTPPDGQGPGYPPGGYPPGGGGQGVGQGGPAGSESLEISSADPASLPLLIRFDKYVTGQQFQGLGQLALRPGSPVLNEALALDLTAATNQPSQRYAYTTYSVNGSETLTRLLVENPDEGYAERLFEGTSVLFKADADSRFSYQGDDQKTYEGQFKQLNKTDSQDLGPIIKFLKWLDGADSATFDADLPTWVDVDSLAKYTATSNLLANSDDMAGPGQNYYLGYGVESKKITVISWDLNLALTNNAEASPTESISMGGGGKGGNSLKSRFLASSVFGKLYSSAYEELFEAIYSSGTALASLDRIAASVPPSEGLGATEIAAKAETIRAFVTQRSSALEKSLSQQ